MRKHEDNSAVRSRTELLESHANQQIKQHFVFDSNGRLKFVFTAVIDALNGKPCLCTEYVYFSDTSTMVRSRQERVSRWNEAWEADFIFDPNTDYDTDGDGTL